MLTVIEDLTESRPAPTGTYIMLLWPGAMWAASTSSRVRQPYGQIPKGGFG